MRSSGRTVLSCDALPHSSPLPVSLHLAFLPPCNLFAFILQAEQAKKDYEVEEEWLNWPATKLWADDAFLYEMYEKLCAHMQVHFDALRKRKKAASSGVPRVAV
jgi:hypothetical protein